MSDDINFYVKYFDDFSKENYNQFLEEMKKNLKEEKSRNNVLDIKGLDDKTMEYGGKEER